MKPLRVGMEDKLGRTEETMQSKTPEVVVTFQLSRLGNFRVEGADLQQLCAAGVLHLPAHTCGWSCAAPAFERVCREAAEHGIRVEVAG